MIKQLNKMLFMITFLLILLPVSVSAASECSGGYCASGTATEANVIKGGTCDVDGFCAYNIRGGSKGIRVSLAYCNASGCNAITNLNGHAIPSYHDYYYTNGSTTYPRSFYHFGKTRLNASTLSSMSISSMGTINSIRHSNSSLVDESSIPMFNPNGTATWFNGIGDLQKRLDKDRFLPIIDQLLKGLNTTREEIKSASKGSTCSQLDLTCEGYRIVIEPIFWWVSDHGHKNWMVTPTEILYLSSVGNNSSSYAILQNNFMNAVNSLYIPENNVYFKMFRPLTTDRPLTNFKTSVDRAEGGALNLVNPLIYEPNTLNCQQLKMALGRDIEREIASYYPGRLKDYYAKYPTLTFGQFGQINTEWYVNECTCYGMYDYFDTTVQATWKSSWKAQIDSLSNNSILGPGWYDRLNNVKMTDLTRSSLNGILNGSFKAYDEAQSNLVKTLNNNPGQSVAYVSTPAITKYNNLSCGSKVYNDSCADLKTWYKNNKPSGYREITSMTENDIRSKDRYYWQVSNMLQAYNVIYAKAHGYYWSNEKYIEECLCPPNGVCPDKPVQPEPTNYNCTPKYNLGSCITGETVFYTDANGRENDSEYWDNCVFSDKGQYDANINHKVSQGGSLEYYEESLGSDYCPVYCVESLTANFDKGNFTVQAGNNFVWGNSSINGSRTCKTKEIDWNRFVSNLNSANNDLASKYVTYKEEEAKQYSIDHAAQEKNSSDCPIKDSKTITSTVKDGVCSGNCNADPGSGWSCGSASSTSCGENCTRYTKRCTKTIGYKTKYTPSAYDFTVTVNGVSKQIKGQVSSWCGDSKPSTDYSKAQRDYNNAKSNVTAVYNSMVSCYTWDKNDLYNLHPSLTLNYSDGYYNYSEQMDEYTTENQTVDNVNQCQNTTVKLEKCNDSGCKLENTSIKKCNSVTMTKNITKNFSLSDDAFRYVLKDSHLSIHAYELGSYSNSIFKTNYTDVGYGNLPVSYSTKDGLYGVNGKGKLSIYYSDLGHDNGSSTTDIDEIFNIGGNSTGKWECPYRVESELIPDKNIRNPKGINVIYRPIDLYDPFPDMDSTGRETGSNWCDGRGRNADCSSKNNTVDKYILNNRDVVGEDVYNKTPMYTFIITPARAKEIRRYNKNNGYDKYTGSLDGKNYDYVCKDKTGGTCISEYLTHIIDITDARNEPGSCVQDRTRNVNDVSAFNNCRY